jgi:hypothetical protein
MANMSEKRGKILGIIFMVIGILVIIGILIGLKNYFQKEVYYTITSNDEVYVASWILYYGPDIGYNPEFDYEDDDWYEKGVHPYSGMEGTNGIICIYALKSKWDRKYISASNIPLFIVGNVSRVHHVYSDSDIEYFDNEIDKYYYKDYWDSYYEY